MKVKIVVTDIRYQMEEDLADGSIKTLEDRVGWWEEDPQTKELYIFVYKPLLTWVQVGGYIVHEWLEHFIKKRIGWDTEPWPHRICCIVEMVITFGRAWPVLYWR